MDVYEAIKGQMGTMVPFAGHTGVVIEEVGPGSARTALEQRQETSNHIGSQHAGALFTLGEAASGAAMAGAFGDVFMEVRPVAARAEIAYLKVAKGKVAATARTGEPVDALRERLDADGKVQFPVRVSIADDAGNEVATMTVEWHVSRRRGG